MPLIMEADSTLPHPPRTWNPASAGVTKEGLPSGRAGGTKPLCVFFIFPLWKRGIEGDWLGGQVEAGSLPPARFLLYPCLILS